MAENGGPSKDKNILLMIADDLGLTLGCYGVKSIQTPHIDKLAAEGSLFTHAFASTASCSGSRSTIYTGLHTHQNGQYGLNHGWNHFQTHDHIETMPQLFNKLGYQTGIISKVHVGPDRVYPWEWFSPSASRNVVENAEEAGRFFDKAQETSRPFHLTIGFRDPHRDETREGFGNDEADVKHIEVPEYRAADVEIPSFLTGVPELRIELAEYYKSISRLDRGVGLTLQKLKERGLDKNTLVVFVSDNGSPFLNSKTTLYDAGVRLPLIVRQPGQPAGITNANMVSFLDLLPTCLDWADAPRSSMKAVGNSNSPQRRGTSCLPIVAEQEVLAERHWKQHVFGSHTFHEIQNYWPTRFVRNRRYKYHRNIAWRLDFPFATDLYVSLSWEGIRNANIKDGEVLNGGDTPELMLGRRRLQNYLFRGPEELFDLANDPEEVENLVHKPELQEVVKEMRAALEKEQYETGDVWLMRDGVSVTTTHAAQKLGLRLPDRFDFDVRQPGNSQGPHWSLPSGKNGSDMVWYG